MISRATPFRLFGGLLLLAALLAPAGAYAAPVSTGRFDPVQPGLPIEPDCTTNVTFGRLQYTIAGAERGEETLNLDDTVAGIAFGFEDSSLGIPVEDDPSLFAQHVALYSTAGVYFAPGALRSGERGAATWTPGAPVLPTFYYVRGCVAYDPSSSDTGAVASLMALTRELLNAGATLAIDPLTEATTFEAAGVGRLLLVKTDAPFIPEQALIVREPLEEEITGNDLCNSPGVIFTGDNPCDGWGPSGSSFFFNDSGGFSTGFLLLFIIVFIGSLALRAWGFSRGQEKGYGLIVSASEDPFLLNELPARPGSEAADEEVAAAVARTQQKSTKPNKRATRRKTATAPRRKRKRT